MKKRFAMMSLSVVMAASMMLSAAGQAASGEMTVQAETGAYQLTGVAVTRSGEVFVNFPKWEEPYHYAVARVEKDGTLTPYPNLRWNTPGKNPRDYLVCVQSVVVDADNMLWILDPAAPGLGTVVPGGTKLLKVNPQTGKVLQVIRFDATALPKSYLNDVRVDVQRQFAYITDSGQGGIVVVDLKSGKSWRTLTADPSTHAEPGLEVVVNGTPLKDPQGKTPQIHSDGIAMTRDGNWLYYHALTGNTLYRIETRYLRDTSVTEAERANAVENLGKTGPTDGMELDAAEKGIYISSFPDNSVKRYDLASRELKTVAQSDDLFWPDTFAVNPDGSLVVTASQIQHMAMFNQGHKKAVLPYKVFKIQP